MQASVPPAAAPVRRPLIKKRKYRPLDAKTWFEGSLRLIGWILIICLSVATGGLWMMYEVRSGDLPCRGCGTCSMPRGVTESVYSSCS